MNFGAFFDNFKFDILNEELRDSLTAYALTAKVVGEGGGGVGGGTHRNTLARRPAQLQGFADA